MRTQRTLATIAVLMLPVLGAANPPNITLPSFADLKQNAQSSLDINFSPWGLRFLGGLLDGKDADSARLKQTLQRLWSVQIRSYEFKDAFEYPKAQLDALRAQLLQPAWSQLVKVRDRDQNESIDVYIAVENHTVEGMTIITCDPRELTVVNVAGSIELDQVDGLRKMFAHPDGRFAQVSQPTP